jgi:NAD(P)-dependent dehydrogenase (short-subunit alcohol dehydrogenase family)
VSRWRDIRRRARKGVPELQGKTCLVTGASSGIGRELAVLLAGYGARVVLVARRRELLAELCDGINASGGAAQFLVCDLSDVGEVERFVADMQRQAIMPDIVVNNAGRSIRRTLIDSADRFHDYERTIRLNYLSAVQLTLALLPAMVARGDGHFVNVGTWGVPAGSMPKFTAYHASKAALSAFSRSMGVELTRAGIAVSTVHYPLVTTPMIAPTADYDAFPALTPSDAAEWVVHAIEKRPVMVQPIFARYLALGSMVAPKFFDSFSVSVGI